MSKEQTPKLAALRGLPSSSIPCISNADASAVLLKALLLQQRHCKCRGTTILQLALSCDRQYQLLSIRTDIAPASCCRCCAAVAASPPFRQPLLQHSCYTEQTVRGYVCDLSLLLHTGLNKHIPIYHQPLLLVADKVGPLYPAAAMLQALPPLISPRRKEHCQSAACLHSATAVTAVPAAVVSLSHDCRHHCCTCCSYCYCSCCCVSFLSGTRAAQL
jgi:hypothetical protein